MDPFRNAAKAFIVDGDGKLLILKREPKDVQKPGMWEIPGGRLEPGEDPVSGMEREIKEETGLDISPVNIMSVKHFTRDDGQKITMLIFYCRPLPGKVVLSAEHVDYEWIDLARAKAKLGAFFHPELGIFERYFKGK